MKNTANQNKPTQGQNSRARTAAESLIDDVLGSDAVLFHDQFDNAYLAWHGDGRQILKLDNREFTRWLAHRYWTKVQKPLPREADKQVVQTLSSFACDKDGQSHDLYVRLAKKDNTLYYDLANGSVVEITSSRWKVVSNPTIMFRRMQQKPQVLPEQNGELGLLRSYVNVASDDDWLLFMVFTVAAFITDFPHPLLVLHGPQGSGKTTPMKVIKQLVDPSVIQGMVLPDKPVEFVQLADHHAFLFFDNLSGMSIKMSDALARAVTGDTFSKRRLYTDNDDVVYKIQSPMAINGINQVISKPDLLDRAILIEFQRIAQEDRIPEDEFWEAFTHDKPQLLGAIFDVLVEAMSIYPTVPSENLPRMADFSRWGCAIAEAAGYKQEDFLNAYASNIERQNDEAIDASPIAKAVIGLLEDCEDGTWQGSPESLLGTLNRRLDTINSSSSPLWPKSPELLSRKLRDAQVNLQAIGIQVDFGRNSRGRFIVLTKTNDDSVESNEPDETAPYEPQQQLPVGKDKDVTMSVKS